MRLFCLRLAQQTYTGLDFWTGKKLRDLLLWADTVVQEVKRNGK